LVELNRKWPFFHLFNGSKGEPKRAFPEALAEIDDFNSFVKKLECPSCKNKESLHINTFERGRKGWEFTVWCNCGANGVLNDTGFHFKRLSQPTYEARTKK